MPSPFEFAQEWGSHLQSIDFAVPEPLLPASTTSFLHYAGVPKKFEITTYQLIRFEFIAPAVNLASVWQREMPKYSLPHGWARLWRIGDITYTQANAWLCIEEVSGTIIAVDVDVDDPLYIVNDSVEGMMRCMKVLRNWVRAADGLLSNVATFQEIISRDPALAIGEAEHYWLPLMEAAVDSGCEKVTLDYE